MKNKIDEEKEYTISLLADVYYDKESIQWEDLKEMAFYLWDVAYLKRIWSRRMHNELKVISLYMYKIYNSLLNKEQKGASLANIEKDSYCKEITDYINEIDKIISSMKMVERYRNRYVTETFYKAIDIENAFIHDDFKNRYGSTMTSYIYALNRSAAETYCHCKIINEFLKFYEKEIIYNENNHKELLLDNCVRIY